jgi:two-component system OmpR family sensor kinase
MADMLENLIDLSQVDTAGRRERNLPLDRVVGEVVRQLRQMALARGVDVRVADGLPTLGVNAPAVELSLTNYLSNAIKYCDRDSPERWVEVRGAVEPATEPRALLVEVEDNGIGVPEDARDRLFQQHFRAATVDDIEGSGVGLSIVRETVESFGGRVWARFDGDGGGSIFGFSLPCRRAVDAPDDPV